MKLFCAAPLLQELPALLFITRLICWPPMNRRQSQLTWEENLSEALSIYSPQIGLWACLHCVNWCDVIQPTVGSTIPWICLRMEKVNWVLARMHSLIFLCPWVGMWYNQQIQIFSDLTSSHSITWSNEPFIYQAVFGILSWQIERKIGQGGIFRASGYIKIVVCLYQMNKANV